MRFSVLTGFGTLSCSACLGLKRGPVVIVPCHCVPPCACRRASAFNDKAPVPIVGFKSYVHACKRDQNSIRLCITSVGPRPTPLKISWKTIGKTAESGKHFHATKG